MSLLLIFDVFISICIVAALYFIEDDLIKASQLSYIFLGSTVVIWTCFLAGGTHFSPINSQISCGKVARLVY